MVDWLGSHLKPAVSDMNVRWIGSITLGKIFGVILAGGLWDFVPKQTAPVVWQSGYWIEGRYIWEESDWGSFPTLSVFIHFWIFKHVLAMLCGMGRSSLTRMESAPLQWNQSILMAGWLGKSPAHSLLRFRVLQTFSDESEWPNPAEVCWRETHLGLKWESSWYLSIHQPVYIYLSTSLSIYIDLFGEGRHLRWWTRLSTTQISAGFLNLNVLAKTHGGEWLSTWLN